MDFDDIDKQRPASLLDQALGEPLDDYSVAELRERIDLLRREISRLETLIEEKQSSLAAAQHLFRD